MQSHQILFNCVSRTKPDMIIKEKPKEKMKLRSSRIYLR